jgi:hypothetical protein
MALTVFTMRLQLLRSRAEGDFGGVHSGPAPRLVRMAKLPCYESTVKVMEAIEAASA